ncbi:PLDc N-terminal domain-containing protein [Paenibacillus ginsengarvi]|uniref:Cardiolipin synthase N-terminal domain-containing protein n=1 Tax=Paenibacillus ginsengarvi TaxID=400777 RepID=A0A3B0BSP0_9BACL|nr:PLDc N-terminal domain-containing protein [Paenibacillus ginsengarvi]RKN75027.1 hypothetical protein D7M11_26185 [Paenibacillus ginsengarvi]
MAIIFTGVLFISLLLLVLHILVCVWAYRDCISRGRSSEYAIVVLVALLFFPVAGLIVYLLIRNN